MEKVKQIIVTNIKNIEKRKDANKMTMSEYQKLLRSYGSD